MTLDGVLAGAVILALGILLGSWLRDRQAAEVDDLEQQFGGMITQQAARNDALVAYINDHSDGEANAEDLGHG